MFRKIFILILTFSLLLITFSLDVNALECKHSAKISKCNEALKDYMNKNWSFITPWDSLRNIQDFVCLQDSPERRVFQIAMEENFKTIDDEMDSYLQTLETSKDVFFWKNAQYDFFDWVNQIWANADYFQRKYENACIQTLEDATWCVTRDGYAITEENSAISIEQAIEFIEWSSWECVSLAKVKVEIFKDIAYNILLLNQYQVNKDTKKLYEQELRTKYDKVIELMMINLWYIEKIRKKWPSKIQHTY